MSRILDLADAIVDELNDAEAFDIVAVRSLIPTYRIGELADLTVTVLPFSVEREQVSRSSVLDKISIQIGVQKKIAEQSECEDLIDLVEDIADYLQGKPFGDANHYETRIETISSTDTLDSSSVFTGVLTLVYWIGINIT